MSIVQHKGIIIHCSATQTKWMASDTFEDQVSEIRRWHVEDNGWRDIGYHLLISRSGEVHEGRPLGTSGAHAKGHNDDVGICLIGGFGSDADDVASDHFTSAQLNALFKTINTLQETHAIQDKRVISHNRVSNKACPGFRAQKWLAGERVARNRPKPERTSATQSKTVKASAATVVASLGTSATSISRLDSTAQYLVLAFAGITVLLAIYILRERLKAWAEGWQ